MKMSPFSAPFFGAPRSEWLLLPKRAAALSEGTQWCKGGTWKAEAAKAGAERNYPSGEPKENRGKKETNVESQEGQMKRPGERFDAVRKGAIVTARGRC